MLRKVLFILSVLVFGVTSITMMLMPSNVVGIAGAVLLGLTVTYVAFSLKTVGPNENGCLLFFGKPTEDVDQGLVIVPAGVFSLNKGKRTLVEYELPGEPQEIYRGEGKVPPGMVEPNRMKFGPPKKDDPEDMKDDPYHKSALVAEVPMVVLAWIYSRMKFLAYFGSMEEFRKTVADKGASVIADDIAQNTPAAALRRLPLLNEKLLTELQNAYPDKDSGIKIKQAFLKPFVFSHSLNKAVEDAAEALQRKDAYVTQKEGVAEGVILEANANAKALKIGAEAKKAALILTGLARADSNGDIKELVPEANVRVQAEAVKELSKTTGTVVLGDAGVMLGIDKKGGGK